MVMVDSCAQIAGDHSRMPLIVQREYWQEWTSGEPEAARKLCRPWGRELTVDRTSQAWGRDRAKPKQVKLLRFFLRTCAENYVDKLFKKCDEVNETESSIRLEFSDWTEKGA